MKSITHWIDGRPWEGPVERRGAVYDPATGEQTGEVTFASPSVLDAAVAAATRAALSWRETSLAARSKVLFAFRDLVERRKKDIAELITREHGKVLSDALGSVNRGLEVIEFA